MRRALLPMLLIVAAAAAPAGAQSARAGQPASRRIATVDALVTYPFFFHGQAVRVRATAREEDGVYRLEHEGRRVYLVAGPGGELPDAGEVSELTGIFLDAGRLDQNDPRQSPDVGRLAERVLMRQVPAPGELMILRVDSALDADPLPAPSVRALALAPERYVDQDVTVAGRFRGRNLYGDLPDAPGKSRWDFVLQTADAAIWVTGRRPRGSGFDLNIDNRVDTDRWLEVAGIVRFERGLVQIEARSIRTAEPPAQSSPEAVVKVPIAIPPPEVVFSAPTEGEIDVEPTATIRIQFSRDLRAASLKGQVVASYVGVDTAPPPFTTAYDGGRRVLEVRFSAPLDPFRTVRITLKEGIVGTDGQALKPFTLTFSVGS